MFAPKALALVSTLLVAAAAAVASAQPTVTEICKLPQPFNNGKVIGHDVGWSTVHDGASWFFFGDTYVDRNGNWQWDGVGTDRFVAGTMFARSTDTNPDDCLDLSYKVDANGEATPLIPKNANETFVWPEGAISLGSSFYTYYGSWQSVPSQCVNGFCQQDAYALCDPQPCPAAPATCPSHLEYRGRGLARINAGATATTTTATRIPGYFFTPGQLGYGNPIRITESTPCGAVTYVYLFASKALGCFGPYEVHLARVAPASIEDPTKYQFWGVQNGNETWVNDQSLSTPILSAPFIFTFNAHFDSSANRFIGTYSCGFLASETCVAWSGVTGNRAAALTGTWTGGSIYACPGDDEVFECYQAYEHSQYQSGNVSYMTGAKNWDGDYWVNLRKVDFGPGH